LLASKYPYFTKKDFTSLKKYDYVTKNRFVDYQKTILLLRSKDKTEQLHRVNFYLNQLLTQYDAVIQKKSNHWSTPKEFLKVGYGDCEDYVIIKYFTLIKLGFDERKLFITTVHEQYTGGYHMVLTYFKDKNKSPLVLDNLSFRVLSLQKRKDLKVDIFINSKGVFKINLKNHLVKIAKAHPMYNNLMKKVQKNR